MAKGLNKVMLIGNLGADPETRFTPSGVAVTNIRLATARAVRDGDGWKDETDWHSVVVWRGEKVAEYLTKGTQIYVEGRLQTRSWEDQSGQKRYATEVVCEGRDMMLLSSKQAAPAPGRPAPQQATADDDDAPF